MKYDRRTTQWFNAFYPSSQCKISKKNYDSQIYRQKNIIYRLSIIHYPITVIFKHLPLHRKTINLTIFQ